jgi:hypothetical protein
MNYDRGNISNVDLITANFPDNDLLRKAYINEYQHAINTDMEKDMLDNEGYYYWLLIDTDNFPNIIIDNVCGDHVELMIRVKSDFKFNDYLNHYNYMLREISYKYASRADPESKRINVSVITKVVADHSAGSTFIENNKELADFVDNFHGKFHVVENKVIIDKKEPPVTLKIVFDGLTHRFVYEQIKL